MSYRKIVIKSEADRYGFSALLARRLGLKAARRSYCTWLHGWMWWEVRTPEELGYGGFAKDIRIVCGTAQQKAMLQRHGYRDVTAGGLPFAYLPPAPVERVKDSLLVFLPHSLDYYKLKVSVTDYLDKLRGLKKDFSRLDVCIYAHDFDEGTQKRECEERGLNPLRGACPDDAEALATLRARLDSYEYVTTPSLGSHIVYAAYCGCKVSIMTPFFCYGEDHYRNDPYVQKYPFLGPLYQQVSSEEYIRTQIPWLVVDHPKFAAEHRAWAALEIGAAHLLDDAQLTRVLGWDAWGQLRGPLMGARRRVRAFLAERLAGGRS